MTGTRRRPPVALTIAGSDPSGGAGIQADLKSFSALGAYGMSVIVALTAQSTTGVTGVLAVPADFVRLQLDTVAADIRIDAVKVGMLGTAELADAVASGLDALRATNPDLPIVVDPVMVATSGSRLLADDAVEAVRRVLDHFVANRQEGESFRQYVLRHRVEFFRAATSDLARPPELFPEIYQDWGDDTPFSLQLGRGECAV